MFKQSLFKELGTNTGKWVSNKVFGDNWSTPYRFSNSGTGMARKALKIEKEIEEKKIDNDLEIEKLKHVFAQNKNYQIIKWQCLAQGS